MSIMRITEEQLAAVFQRRPLVQVHDVESGSAVLTRSNNPLALYIMHITKIEDKTVRFTRNKAKTIGNRAPETQSISAMKAWMILGSDCAGRVACFFVSDPNLWSGLIKQHRIRKGLREGEVALIWPIAGGDHVFQGATVLTVSTSTIIRALADYDDDLNAWEWFRPSVRSNIDLQVEDWQLCVMSGVQAQIVSNDINPFQCCGGQICGGRHRTNKPDRNWVCKVCAESTQLYTGYEYALMILRDNMEALTAVVCGHIAMHMVNEDWPTYESVDYPTFESSIHESFPDAGLLVDLTAWCKIGKVGDAVESDRWAYGEASLHVIDIRPTPVAGVQSRVLLPIWTLKGRTPIDVPFTPIAANLLGNLEAAPGRGGANHQGGASQSPARPVNPLMPKTFPPGWAVPQGIRNAGDTCATSTIIQFLLCNAEISEYATSAQPTQLQRVVQKLYVRGVEATLSELAQLHRTIQGFCDPSVSRSADAAEMLAAILDQNPSMRAMSRVSAIPVPGPACGHVVHDVDVFPGPMIPVLAPADSGEHTTLELLIADQLQDEFSYACDACRLDHNSNFSQVTWPKFLYVHLERSHFDFNTKSTYTSRAVVTVTHQVTVDNVQYETKALGLHDKDHWTSTVSCKSNESFYFCDDSTVVRHLSARGVMRWPIALPTVCLVFLQRVEAQDDDSTTDDDFVPSMRDSDDSDDIDSLPDEPNPVHDDDIVHPTHKRPNEFRSTELEDDDSSAEEQYNEEEEPEEEEDEEDEWDSDDDDEDEDDSSDDDDGAQSDDTSSTGSPSRSPSYELKATRTGQRKRKTTQRFQGDKAAKLNETGNPWSTRSTSPLMRVPDLLLEEEQSQPIEPILKFVRPTPSTSPAEASCDPNRIWLNVAYANKDIAKNTAIQHGGRLQWDSDVRKWWVPASSATAVKEALQAWIVQSQPTGLSDSSTNEPNITDGKNSTTTPVDKKCQA